MAPIQPMTIYAKAGANCTSTPASAGLDYYAIGAEIPPSAFVEGSVEIAP